MSWETFQAVASQVVSSGRFDMVNFSGMGEPTLNPHLPQFIAYLTSQHIPARITTNLLTLNPDKIERLIQAGLEQVIFSLSGHTPELYAQMSGGHSLDEAVAQVKNLVALGVPLVANVSVTRQTQAHLAEIRAFLHDLGVQDMFFSLCHSRGGYLQDLSICQTPLPLAGLSRCDIFSGTLFVAWDGHALACCHDLEALGDLGDLTVVSIEDVLEKKRRIMAGGRLFSMCAQCNDLYRFQNDPMPQWPLSEWVYQIYSEQNPQQAALIQVIRDQEARIAQLENLVAAYERGRFMRFTRWLHQVVSQIGPRRKRI